MRFVTVANEKNAKTGTVGKKVTNNNTKGVFYISNIEVPELESGDELGQTFNTDQLLLIINELAADRASNLACVPLRIASAEKLTQVAGKEKDYVGADSLIAEGLKAAKEFDFKSLLGRAEGVNAKAKKVDQANEFMKSQEYLDLVASGNYAEIAAKLASYIETK